MFYYTSRSNLIKLVNNFITENHFGAENNNKKIKKVYYGY